MTFAWYRIGSRLRYLCATCAKEHFFTEGDVENTEVYDGCEDCGQVDPEYARLRDVEQVQGL